MVDLLRTERMEKVRMLFSDRLKDKVISYLHENGFLDIRKSRLELEDDAPSFELNELSELLIRVDGAIETIEKFSNKKEKKADNNFRPYKKLSRKELIEKAKRLKTVEKALKLNELIKEEESNIESLKKALNIGLMFQGIMINFSKLDSDYISYKAYLVSRNKAEQFSNALKKIENAEVIKKELDERFGKKVLFFIAYEKGMEIESIFGNIGAEELDLKAKHLEKDPDYVVEKCSREIDKIKNKIKEAENSIKRMQKNLGELLAYREMLEIEIERESVKSNFKKTGYVFLVEGWIPKKDAEKIKNGLDKITNGEFELEVLEKEKDELAPTLTNRPKFLKPFDYMMEFYSIPRSDEIDPTWIFIISFPIFYGLMLSDVGYGIASLIFVTWITRFTNPEGLVYNAAKIWQIAAISSIFFGVLSNQYFGYQLNKYIGLGNFGFDWLKDATTILLATILFGVAQVSLGLFFGFINKWDHGEKIVAISKITSILTIFTGIFAVGGFFFHIISASLTIYFGIAAIAFLVATALMSGIEAAEITNLMTHPLSYARILGFGMSSVIIAMLIDQAFTPTLSHGIIIFLLLLILFILLHFMNMILGIFEGIVQGVRLNFVEFFSKFYIGGGIKFKPFYYKKKYVK